MEGYGDTLPLFPLPFPAAQAIVKRPELETDHRDKSIV